MNVPARVSLIQLLPEWLNRPVLPVQVAKEVQPALPAWIGSIVLPALMVLANPMENGVSFAGSLYAIFACALASNAFGFEFSQRTVWMPLSQPIS
jgi:ABC-type transport system involved in multi-copper enzyme maturation permease subunit